MMLLHHQFPTGILKVLHVKGHQDSNQPAATLPWPAQLNVIANREANNYSIQQHRHPSLNTWPFLPSAQIHLCNSHQQIVINHWNFHLCLDFHCRQYKCPQIWPKHSSDLQNVPLNHQMWQPPAHLFIQSMPPVSLCRALHQPMKSINSTA